MLKCRRKSRWVTETDSPLLTDASYTNTRCSAGQVSIATEVANQEEKNADHLVSPSAYLLSTTHSKDVRFPWVTLYIRWTKYTLSQICVFCYSFKECTSQFQLNRTEFIQGFKKCSRCLDANAVCIVYYIFIYTWIMIVEHTPVSILLLQILANVCKTSCIFWYINFSFKWGYRCLCACFLLYLVLPDDDSDEPKYVGQ